MRLMRPGRRAGHRFHAMRRLAAAFMLGLLLLALLPGGAGAHAELASSTPSAGAVLPTAPATVVLTFTEPLDQSYSRAQLYDARGDLLGGTTLTFGADQVSLTLALPPTLPTGTYSVLWRTLSSADGHTAENFFAFTVGTTADISAITIPSTATGGGPPQWLQTSSRWAALLGLAAALAIWPIWLLVLRPALGPAWRSAPLVTRRMQRYALIALIAAALGSICALLVQAAALDQGPYLAKVATTLGQTRYGTLWLLRMGLLFCYASVLAACAWWWPRHRQAEATLALLLAGALPVPFSLISHASATPAGETTTVLADALHLLGASLWTGGLLLLTCVLFPVVRRLEPGQARCVLARALPRFSLLALAAWGVMGLTGLYAAWLHVGNLAALTQTSYGTALLVKGALLGGAFAIAAGNLLVVSRRLETPAIEEGLARVWSRRLALTVAAELVLVIAAYGAVGQLTSTEPARDVLVQRAKQITLPFDLGDRRADLLIAPGVAGVNHLRLEVRGAALPTNAQALLRLTLPARPAMGTKQLQLARVAGNAFEYHSNDLGLAGTWQLTAILRFPDGTSASAQQSLTLGLTRANVDVPGNPWRFQPTGGVSGLLLATLGVIGIVIGIFNRARLRKEGLGLGFAALALGALLLVQARIDPALAVSAGNAIDPSGDPAQCTVAPRTAAEIDRLTAATTPLPPAAPPRPADHPTVAPAVQAAITTTLTQYVACSNEQDTLRWLALFSDAAIQRSFPDGTSPSLTRTVATPPAPLPQMQWATLTSITGFTSLADGRVEVQIAVTVPGGTAPADAMPDGMAAGTSNVTVILVQQGDRWLIDELGMAGM